MQRSSSRSRMLKLLEKPVEPPKKGNKRPICCMQKSNPPTHHIHIFVSVSMNKIKVGNAPPPNLRQVRSKIGSLDNATHKPGGGNIKIETKKLDFKVQPRIEAKNEAYAPKGGDKKVKFDTRITWKHFATFLHRPMCRFSAPNCNGMPNQRLAHWIMRTISRVAATRKF